MRPPTSCLEGDGARRRAREEAGAGRGAPGEGVWGGPRDPGGGSGGEDAPVHGREGVVAVAGVVVGQEGEAPEAPRLPVRGQVDVLDLAVLAEDVAELALVGL